MEHNFQHYLNSKRTVDDRAINRLVWQQLSEQLLPLHSVHVLEIGAGTGTMLHRLVEWGGLKRGTYLGIDADHDSIEAARVNLPRWAAAKGMVCTHLTGGHELTSDDSRLRAAFSPLDLQKFLESPTAKGFDLIVANAFLDLVDPDVFLPQLGPLLKPNGLGWFTINFDGLTLFEPVFDKQLDEKILQLYHRSMDERRVQGKETGGSQTGRHLYHQLSVAGWQVMAAGASDWVVHPIQGFYPHEEAYFLHHILHFFELTLIDHPELDQAAFLAWLAARRAQITAGELVFIAHQLDFLARWPK
jgi:SAM-dependent methyltransferase